MVNLQAGCSTQVTERKDNRLHSNLLNVLRAAGLVAEAKQEQHCPPSASVRLALFGGCKGIQFYILFTLKL